MAIETRILQGKTVFGDWEVKEYIGSGSGGKTAVFRIARRREDWEESAALKVVNILEEVGQKEELSEAYRKEYDGECTELCRQAEEEIRLMNQLKGNPHIVDCYDFLFVDYQEENVFGTDLLIRMELLESLWEARKLKGEYREDEVVKIGRDICKGLAFCHDAGIIHRDIKPANIFVTTFGDYKLGDFGIARVVDAGQKASTKMGTRAYAAPEQFVFNEEKYDYRVDIYSLGLTLYELTNHNRLPFAASGYVRESEIQKRITGREFPAPEAANPALGAVIKKACAFEAEQRYASAEDLEEALMAAEVGVFHEEEKAEETKSEIGKEKEWRIPAVLLGMLLLLIVLSVLIPFYLGKVQTLPADKTVSQAGSGEENTPHVTDGQITAEIPGTDLKPDIEEHEKKFEKAAYVTAQNDTMAVITQTGDLYMWGKNEYGQLGCGDTQDRDEPVLIMENVARVYLSEKHTAALTPDGRIFLWGCNGSAQIGKREGKELQLLPTLVLTDVKEVSLGGSHSGALCNNGDLYTWGSPSGNGVGEWVYVPTLLAKNIVGFSMNDSMGGAVTEEGDLYMWGSNWSGQVGNGTKEEQLTPVLIMDEVAKVYVGENATAAIKTNADLYVWGYNSMGQVGVGNNSRWVYEPTHILSDVEEVFFASNHSGAITKGGDLYMWGDNGNRQIGAGGAFVYEAPQWVCGNVKTVVLGERHTAVIKGNNDLYMWGENTDGQIDDSGLYKISTPVRAARNIVSVGLGWDATYLIDTDGNFYRWGK